MGDEALSPAGDVRIVLEILVTDETLDGLARAVLLNIMS
jgi:hypothetical protein